MGIKQIKMSITTLKTHITPVLLIVLIAQVAQVAHQINQDLLVLISNMEALSMEVSAHLNQDVAVWNVVLT